MIALENDVFEFKNAEVILKNFAGRADKYKAAGNPSFGLLLTPEEAEEFEDLGIPVKYLKPRHDEDPPIPFVMVKVKFNRGNRRPPHIVMRRVSSDGTVIDKTPLTEETMKTLDYADIDTINLQVAIFNWEFNGKRGKSLSLDNWVCDLSEDDFLTRYDIDDVYN